MAVQRSVRKSHFRACGQFIFVRIVRSQKSSRLTARFRLLENIYDSVFREMCVSEARREPWRSPRKAATRLSKGEMLVGLPEHVIALLAAIINEVNVGERRREGDCCIEAKNEQHRGDTSLFFVYCPSFFLVAARIIASVENDAFLQFETLFLVLLLVNLVAATLTRTRRLRICGESLHSTARSNRVRQFFLNAVVVRVEDDDGEEIRRGRRH